MKLIYVLKAIKNFILQLLGAIIYWYQLNLLDLLLFQLYMCLLIMFIACFNSFWHKTVVEAVMCLLNFSSEMSI